MLQEVFSTRDENTSSCLHRPYSNQEYYNKNALLDAGNARKCNQTFLHVLLYLEYFLNNIIATEEGIKSNMLMG